MHHGNELYLPNKLEIEKKCDQNLYSINIYNLNNIVLYIIYNFTQFIY